MADAGLPLAEDLEDAQPPCFIREVHPDNPVKPPGAQESRIEDICPVGSSHHQGLDFPFTIDSVQLDQELVQSLIVFHMPLVTAPLCSEDINFVDEHHTTALFLLLGQGFCLLEEAPDPLRAHPSIHLHKL